MPARLVYCERASRHSPSTIRMSCASVRSVQGPPPSTNYTAPQIDIHARSFCVFSGLNDSPLGDPDAGDPGGITQSFGSFIASSGASVPDLDPKSTFGMPGFGCNPNRGVDLHGGG